MKSPFPVVLIQSEIVFKRILTRLDRQKVAQNSPIREAWSNDQNANSGKLLPFCIITSGNINLMNSEGRVVKIQYF